MLTTPREPKPCPKPKAPNSQSPQHSDPQLLQGFWVYPIRSLQVQATVLQSCSIQFSDDIRKSKSSRTHRWVRESSRTSSTDPTWLRNSLKRVLGSRRVLGSGLRVTLLKRLPNRSFLRGLGHVRGLDADFLGLQGCSCAPKNKQIVKRC